MKAPSLILLLLAMGSWLAAAPVNVVWIIADDLGPELGCYGYSEVDTPNLDRMAGEGARYTAAFSTSPVCSASRTAFQTGRYQTEVGGHHHNTRIRPLLGKGTPSITELMQEAGYFVVNGRGTRDAKGKPAKSHLNFEYDAKTFFDGTDWTQRKDGQAFFAQIQIGDSHRKFINTRKARPKAEIPPYYPEHPVVRMDWSNYLASIEELDRKVGEVLDRLDEEGLADDTLVIFFGDHGRAHVRGKQWLYDGGLHTPLLVRWPGRVDAGQVHDGLVSLLDLMPSTLGATGIEAPKDLPGLNLFDPSWKGHDEIFAARDRCGDAPDRIRAVRTGDFKYIRNYHPELPYMQHSGYKKLSYPAEAVMKVMHAKGTWTSPFMAETRPREELYDLSKDPWEMVNLAGDPGHAVTLRELSGRVDAWIEETKDQGAIDEWQTVDREALMAEKWRYYEKTMRSRGLDPEISDEDYLQWWEKELGVDVDPE